MKFLLVTVLVWTCCLTHLGHAATPKAPVPHSKFCDWYRSNGMACCRPEACVAFSPGHFNCAQAKKICPKEHWGKLGGAIGETRSFCDAAYKWWSCCAPDSCAYLPPGVSKGTICSLAKDWCPKVTAK